MNIHTCKYTNNHIQTFTLHSFTPFKYSTVHIYKLLQNVFIYEPNYKMYCKSNSFSHESEMNAITVNYL